MTGAALEARSVEQLVAACTAGATPKFVLFWGHEQRSEKPTAACLSQWYPAEFELGGVTYATAEHFLMAEKARLFGDEATAAEIIASAHPGEAKNLGRQVVGFEDDVWISHRFEIGVAANVAKFGQNPALGAFLTATSERVLVEASPLDRIWGIGLAADDPAALDPGSWQGSNLLGFVLMETRARLAL